VLGEAAVVVCHGGSGTVFGALGAGVPLVMLPMFADQPTNAAMVEEYGAGRRVIEGGKSADENRDELEASLERLREALLDVLSASRYREAASVLALELKAAYQPLELADLLARGL
jgi:UDP:flavonoid glycosyltransferase YjiC (YdhE family)